MKICDYHDVMIVEEYPGITKREIINADDGAPNYCMRIFEIEPGKSTPYHSHPWEHEVFILTGKGEVSSKQGKINVTADTVIFVPPNEKHCLANSGDEILRFICVIPIRKEA